MKPSSVAKLIIVAAAVGAGVYFAWPAKKETGASYGKIERRDLLQRVTIAGAITPKRRTLVTAPYNGYVKEVFVEVGQKVKAGEPLVSVTQALRSQEPVFPLRAPYAGTVVHVNKKEGENVKEADSAEYLMRIDDLTRLYVEANAPEIDRVKLKKGQETVIKASAVLDRAYKGVITELTLAPKGSSNNQQEYPVRIEVRDNDKALGPGMSVVVDIITDKRKDVLTVRHEFLQRDEDGQYFVRTKTGEKRAIKVGMQNEEAFEVLDGAPEGLELQQIDFSSLSPKE